MPGPYNIRKYYQPPVGLDLRSSMMTRSPNSATSMKNVDYTYTSDGDAITQRVGYQFGRLTESSNVEGLFTRDGVSNGEGIRTVKYTRVDSSTGLQVQEHLLLSISLYKINDESVTIYYTGGGTATADIASVAGVWTLTLVDVGVSTDAIPLTATLVSLADLQTSVNALANFSMVIGDPDGTSQRQAVIDGTQAATNTITVDDGAGGNHNFRVGDQVTFLNQAATRQHRVITEVAGTTISFAGAAVAVTDNDSVDFSMSLQQARGLKDIKSTAVTASGLAITFWEPVSVLDIATVSGGLFINMAVKQDDPEFRPPSTVNINNVIYISAPFEDGLGISVNNAFKKYDGQHLYRAGMPRADDLSVVGAGSGSGLAAGTYKYIATWIQEDHQGNIVEGIESENEDSVTLAAAEDVTVTIAYTNIAQLDGYLADSNRAFVVGNQTGVTTINVDQGSGLVHGLTVGSKIYFLDRSSGDFLDDRTVTSATYASTGGTITISGAAVNVNDNDIISALAKVAIYRTKVGGNDFFLVDEIPFGQTTYTDDTADASLGAQYLFPESNETHDIPPVNPIFLATHQGSLVIGGSVLNPNTVFPSVPGSPEYFPSGLQFDVISPSDNQIVSGIGSNEQFLLVFKEDSTSILSGQILNPFTVLPAFRVDLLSGSIGCLSHETIQNVEGALLFLSRKGPMQQAGGAKPVPLLDAFTSVFTRNSTLAATSQLQFIRSVAMYDPVDRKYFLYMPASNANKNGGNANSKLFIYDVERQGWREWTNINMAGGAIFMSPGDIRFLSWTATATTIGTLYRFLSFGDEDDLTDDAAAIDWELIPGWESLGEPSVFKKWLRTRVFAPLAESPDFTLTVATQSDWSTSNETSGTIDFDGTGANPRPMRLLPRKNQSLRYKFTHNTIYERILISGWESEVVAPYKVAIKE